MHASASPLRFPYNNVFLLHVGRIVPALTHLAPHPYSYPLPLRLGGEKKKKESIGPRAFPFSRPRAVPEQLLLIWRSKESLPRARARALN